MDTLAICAPRIAQDAALFGLDNLEQWVADKRVGILERLKYVNKIFRNSETSYELISSGAYFAYVKHPFKEKSSSEKIKATSKISKVIN